MYVTIQNTTTGPIKIKLWLLQVEKRLWLIATIYLYPIPKQMVTYKRLRDAESYDTP
jgi:hypothetical protein